jgi:hypothetical protein
MIRFFLLAFYLTVSFSGNLVAEDLPSSQVKKSLSIFDPKTPTPSRFFAADISMPEHFATSNNLAKKVGSFYRAFGEVIFAKCCET